MRLPDGVRKVDCWGGSKAIMVMRAGHLEMASPKALVGGVGRKDRGWRDRVLLSRGRLRTAHPPPLSHDPVEKLCCFRTRVETITWQRRQGGGGRRGQPGAGLPPPPTRHRQRRVEEDGSPTAWQHRVYAVPDTDGRHRGRGREGQPQAAGPASGSRRGSPASRSRRQPRA